MLLGVVSLIAGYQRRWMSDDGLIVLRTVRNIMAGNGPVFNTGERVETNTSTLWQYLIAAGAYISGRDLSVVAFGGALFLSVAAIVIGVMATGALFTRGYDTSRIVLPAGVLIYLALPPARDFFTSGLEWGLSIFYLAVLWALLVWWSRAHGNTHLDASVVDASVICVAFWSGLSWLVRPELALYGGMAGIALFMAHRGIAKWSAILAVALPIPLGYQIFRMGYYGLLTPHTAVAKSASGSNYASGWTYAADFVGPYVLWLPVGIVSLVGIALVWTHRRQGGIRQPATVVAVLVVCSLLHFFYVVRVGGDFMHGRMLLLPLFAFLLPLFVLPLRIMGSAVAGVLVSAGLAAWAITVAYRGLPSDWSTFDEGYSVVDEREFWTYATGRESGHPPMNEKDYLGALFLGHWEEGLADMAAADGAMMSRYRISEDSEGYAWRVIPREEGRTDPATVYLVNLGMSSANAPLDVRVLDNIGLATPLAARQPRLENARIGHDKNLERIWQAADSAADLDQLPDWIDTEGAKAARQALADDQFQRLFATYRAPLTAERFWKNIVFALGEGRTLEFSSDPHDYIGPD